MALLLFVRSTDDLLSAVEATSDFLAYQQRHLEGSRQSDDLLAIWIDADLDAALPAWSIPWLHSSSEGPNLTPFRVRESFSLSEIWTLCWVDISMSESRLGPDSQREALLEILLGVFSTLHLSNGAGPFFPVFGPGVPTERIETTMSDFKARYPGLIGATWFVHDRSQGKIVPAERAEGLRH
jgi:hypothetical protein